MHQIRFRLGLRTRPPLGELTALPRPPSWILGVLLLRERKEEGRGWDRKERGREGRGREGGEEKGRGREGTGEGRDGEGNGKGSPPIISHTPQFRISKNMPELYPYGNSVHQRVNWIRFVTILPTDTTLKSSV